jgi:hypothetical protein
MLPPSTHIGGFKRALREPLMGLWGASWGAKMPGSTRRKIRMNNDTPGNRFDGRSVCTILPKVEGASFTVAVACAIPCLPFS